MRSPKLLALLPLLVLLVLIGSLAYHAFWEPNSFSLRREISVTVSRGSTFKEISDSLELRGIIENKGLFQIAGRILGWTTQMKVGKYVFPDGISNYGILSSLHTGKSIVAISVTIPEGYTSAQVARILSRRIGTDSSVFVRLVHDTSFAQELGLQEFTLEGYLMPDTYQFYWQMDEREIIRELVTQFQKFFDDSLADREKELGLTTTKLLTVASIVEGEAVVDSERAIIAGVFYNRLKKGMRLEADPTVQYALNEGPHRVHYRDLTIESPYNTYLHPGLPPTPINNPGRKSILAALHPAKHNYLYFVSNGEGGHVFSKTYEEHQKAVRRYRRLREMVEAKRDSTIN
ncbi:MAG: endolytic transglycosylase MltG [Bacteroidota bacterium]